MSAVRRIAALSGNLALLAVALGLTLGVTECALRAFPRQLLPSGVFVAGRWSPDLQMNVTGGTLYYNKVRFVASEPNREGFLDVDHAREKPPGTVRVGFFGDSYVEAGQVLREQAFFRRLPTSIGGHALEAFAYGRSGWGAIQALTAWRVFGPRYDMDVVAYVFVENDPGDSDWKLQLALRRGSPGMLYADLADGAAGFDVHWTQPPGSASLARRAFKRMQEGSLLAQIVVSRWFLLRARGVQVQADAREAAMATHALGAVPDPNDSPTSWPAEYRAHAEELNRRLLAAWSGEVSARGGSFFVFYVPRGISQLTGEVPVSETWRPWLGRTCAELGIPLVDPSPILAQRLAAGDLVFDDHFSPIGHEVVARILADHLATLPAFAPPAARR